MSTVDVNERPNQIFGCFRLFLSSPSLPLIRPPEIVEKIIARNRNNKRFTRGDDDMFVNFLSLWSVCEAVKLTFLKTKFLANVHI